MKIKKVLCLGAVLGAVLSVGMITSAMAAPTDSEYPTDPVVMGEYPFNNTTISVGTAGKYVDPEGKGRADTLAFNTELSADNSTGVIKIKQNGYVSFITKEDCWLTIMPEPANDNASSSVSLTLYKSTAAPDMEANTVLKPENCEQNVVTSTDAQKVIYYHLTTPGKYYFENTANKSYSVEEFEFTAEQPPEVMWRPKIGTGDSVVAFCKSGETYYAIAVIADNDNTKLGWTNAYLVPGSSTQALTGDVDCGGTFYKEVTINEQTYDAAEFVTGLRPDGEPKTGYLYAVKLTGVTPEFESALEALTPGSDTQAFIKLSETNTNA